MKKKWDIYVSKLLATPLLFIALCCCFGSSIAQECPQLLSPVAGAELVSVTSSIRWETVEGVPGYIISLGTTPGAGDILNGLNVGGATQYTPTLGLPENTEIFVTITLFFFNQENISCESQRFTTAPLTDPPGCTALDFPVDGARGINTATNLSWNSTPFSEGYFLTIGTSPNGGEIIDGVDVGNTLNYNPVENLPTETDIYVTVIPYNSIGLATGCSASVFTTASTAILPNCTNLVTPLNGETNVPLSPILEWNEVPEATGYRVSIGTSPFETNILNNAQFFTTSTLVIDFEPNHTFFVTIVPFNDAGEAIGCTQETFSTLLGCGPYFEPLTGELVVLNPDITFPDTIEICLNRNSTLISATDEADGYRWFKVDANGNPEIISSSANASITEIGEYIYEAYNSIQDSGRNFECTASKSFQVNVSEVATIENIAITQQVNGLNIEIQVEGMGSYEYALDDEIGPYQDSNNFSGVAPGNHIVFVRDKNGCGIAQEVIAQDLTVEGFPKFFTPNGDGVNDFWQFIPPINTVETTILSILIFDRFGRLLHQIDSDSLGWDGTFNNKPMPESDYWFKANFLNKPQAVGHFSLKR